MPDRPALAAAPLLLALDVLACAALALAGPLILRALDPLRIFVAPGVHAAFALLFALVGPLGAGIERGHAGWAVRGLTTLGATGGALLGAWFLEGERDTNLLALRVLIPFAAGPFLARAGARFHRPEELWRAEARLRPPEATPELALRIAHLRLPLVVRIALLPLALALLPVAVAGLVFIRCYQLAVSRFLPPQCRFEPSCSRYGFQAIFQLGAVRGFLLTAFRLVRCQPFCRAGHDPVPFVGQERG